VERVRRPPRRPKLIKPIHRDGIFSAEENKSLSDELTLIERAAARRRQTVEEMLVTIDVRHGGTKGEER
jgi:hypothetical protein